MRNMTHTEFCSVCKEGMWYQFLRRISLIGENKNTRVEMEVKLITNFLIFTDDVNVSKIPNSDRTKRVVLNTLKLGQLRESGNEIENETLVVRWSHAGQERPEFNDQFEIDAEGGSWSVDVEFVTPEVRYDPNGLLRDVVNFTITFPVNATMHSVPSVNFTLT